MREIALAAFFLAAMMLAVPLGCSAAEVVPGPVSDGTSSDQVAETMTGPPQVDLTPAETPTTRALASETPASPKWGTAPASGEPTAADLQLPSDVRLAYVNDSGLFIRDGSGTARQLADRDLIPSPGRIREIKLSPDGEWIAFRNDDAGDKTGLWLVPVVGSAPRLVASDAWLTQQVGLSPRMPVSATVTVKHFDWLPSGDAVGFTTWETHFPPDRMGTAEYRDDLWTVSVSGGNPTMVLQAGVGGHFAFSPDGGHVILTRSEFPNDRPTGVVTLVELETDTRRRLLEHPTMGSGSDWLPYALPVWADERTAYIAVPGAGDADRDGWAVLNGPTVLYRLPVDGEPEAVSELGSGSTPWRQNAPFFSPDRERLVFMVEPAAEADASTEGYPQPTDAEGGRQDSPYNRRHVHVLDLTDRAASPLGLQGFEITHAAWRPSGGSVAISVSRLGTDGRVRVVTNLVRLAPGWQTSEIPTNGGLIEHWIDDSLMLGIEPRRRARGGGPQPGRVLLFGVDGTAAAVASAFAYDAVTLDVSQSSE